MASNLPPIPDESFDGEKQKTEVRFERCKHEKSTIINGELRCPCGAAWSGPGLHALYTSFHKG